MRLRNLLLLLGLPMFKLLLLLHRKQVLHLRLTQWQTLTSFVRTTESL